MNAFVAYGKTGVHEWACCVFLEEAEAKEYVQRRMADNRLENLEFGYWVLPLGDPDAMQEGRRAFVEKVGEAVTEIMRRGWLR